MEWGLPFPSLFASKRAPTRSQGGATPNAMNTCMASRPRTLARLRLALLATEVSTRAAGTVTGELSSCSGAESDLANARISVEGALAKLAALNAQRDAAPGAPAAAFTSHAVGPPLSSLGGAAPTLDGATLARIAESGAVLASRVLELTDLARRLASGPWAEGTRQGAAGETSLGTAGGDFDAEDRALAAGDDGNAEGDAGARGEGAGDGEEGAAAHRRQGGRQGGLLVDAGAGAAEAGDAGGPTDASGDVLEGAAWSHTGAPSPGPRF